MMGSNRSTVVVTVTDYTTVFPTTLLTTSTPGATTTITLTEYTTIFPTSSLKTSISDATSLLTWSKTGEISSAGSESTVPDHSYFPTSSASSLMLSSSLPVSSPIFTAPSSPTSTSVPSPTAISSLQVSLPLFVFPSSTTSTFSTSATSTFPTSTSTLIASSSSSSSSSSPNPGLPTGWPAPDSQQSINKHYSNALPILMILLLVFIALLFLGALIYFAWRFARGNCADCDLKTADILHLQTRLAGRETATPASVQHRVTLHDEMRMGLGRGQEAEVSRRDLEGEGITFSVEDPERGIRVRLNSEDGKGFLSRQSERSDPFNLENVVTVRSHFSDDTAEIRKSNPAERTSAQSTNALWRSGLSMEENRALALAELERNHSMTQEELQSPIPFWKRALARVGVKPVGRGEATTRIDNDTEALIAGPEYRPMMRVYSDSGRAVVPRALLQAHHAQHTLSKPGPYPLPPARAYFEDTGSSSSGHSSSNAVPKQHLQPMPQLENGGFITVGLEDDLEENQVDPRRATGIRNKHRTGGYGGMGSILPHGMDGNGAVPRRV